MRRKNTWRILAIPLIAAGVATALVVTTGTRTVSRPAAATMAAVDRLAQPLKPLNGSDTGGTLAAEVTPTGLAMAPDWLKPCLSQGIKIQPPNTTYPTLGGGIQLPKPFDPTTWQGFDCHVLDNQLMVPNWIDPDDTYGSMVQHIQPEDRGQLEPLLQQAQKAVAIPQGQSGGSSLGELIGEFLYWLAKYSWIIVGILIAARLVSVVLQGQRTEKRRDDNGCDTTVLENELDMLIATGAKTTTGVGYDDNNHRYQLSSGTNSFAAMADETISDQDLTDWTLERMRQLDPKLVQPPIVGKVETHVEPKMATYMHKAGVIHVCMVINQPKGPCPYDSAEPSKNVKGCRDIVPPLLGAGHVLDVYWENTPFRLTHKPFVGIGV